MTINKLKPKQPDPYVRKAVDQELAKFGHLNWLIDQINLLPSGQPITASYPLQVSVGPAQNMTLLQDYYPTQGSLKTVTSDGIWNYVANIATNLIPQDHASLATTGPLPAYTYNNGASGVGATLTGNSTGVLTVDGNQVLLNQGILVKDEAVPANNGIYICTTEGSASPATAFVLTRRSNYDAPSEIKQGTFFSVLDGSTNSNTVWVMSSPDVTTVGSDPITFSFFFNGIGVSRVGLATTNQVTYWSGLNSISGTAGFEFDPALMQFKIDTGLGPGFEEFIVDGVNGAYGIGNGLFSPRFSFDQTGTFTFTSNFFMIGGVTYVFPGSYPSAGQVLANNGSGLLSWVDKEEPLTFSAPLIRSTNTISIPAASSITDGYLSASDWSYFASKLDSGGGPDTAIAYWSLGLLAGDGNLTWDQPTGTLDIGVGIFKASLTDNKVTIGSQLLSFTGGGSATYDIVSLSTIPAQGLILGYDAGALTWLNATQIAGGAALTRGNDTNITLTLGGSPSNALFRAVSISAGWQGVLGVTRGGTGTGTAFTSGRIVFAGSAGVYNQSANLTFAANTLTVTGASIVNGQLVANNTAGTIFNCQIAGVNKFFVDDTRIACLEPLRINIGGGTVNLVCASSGSYTFTFPNAMGSEAQVLTTQSGVCTWTNKSLVGTLNSYSSAGAAFADGSLPSGSLYQSNGAGTGIFATAGVVLLKP